MTECRVERLICLDEGPVRAFSDEPSSEAESSDPEPLVDSSRETSSTTTTTTTTTTILQLASSLSSLSTMATPLKKIDTSDTSCPFVCGNTRMKEETPNVINHDKLNVVILYDSTGSMGSVFSKVCRIAEMILSLGLLFSHTLSLSLVTFKDFDSKNNGIEGIFDIQSIEEIRSFIKRITASGGGDNMGEAGISALLWCMNRIPEGLGTLYYMITDDDIRILNPSDNKTGFKADFKTNAQYNIPAYRHSAYLDDLESERRETEDKLDIESYCIANIYKRLRMTNSKFTILGHGDQSNYRTLEHYAKFFEVFRPLVEVFLSSFHCMDEIRMLICEDILINLLDSDPMNVVEFLGTKLRLYGDTTFCLGKLGLGAEYSNMCKSSIEGRKTSTKKVQILLDGEIHSTKFLHFPICNKKLKMDVDISKMIEMIKKYELMPLLASIPSLGMYCRRIIETQASEEDKQWYFNNISNVMEKTNLQNMKLNLAKIRSNSNISLAGNNMSLCDGFYVLTSPVDNWTAELTHTEFFNMIDDKIYEWMLKKFIPFIAYIPNNPRNPPTDQFTSDGFLKYIPSNYPNGGQEFTALQLLPMLVSSAAFTASDLILLIVAALIVKCETACMQLKTLAISTLRTVSEKISFLEPKLHSSNLQRLLLHSRVQGYLEQRFLNFLIKSFQINTLYMIIRQNESIHVSTVLLRFDPKNAVRICTTCQKPKTMRHFTNSMLICNYCAVVSESGYNDICTNMSLIFHINHGPLIKSRSKNKETIKDYLDKNHISYEDKDIKLECSLCYDFYYISNIVNLPLNKKIHKCPRCRLLNNNDPKTLTCFKIYLLYHKNYNGSLHLLHLEFIKFHKDNILLAGPLVTDPLEAAMILEAVTNLINQNKTPVKLTTPQEYIHKRQDKRVMELISKELMEALIEEQLNQKIPLDNIWGKETPNFVSTFTTIDESLVRNYDSSEIEDILDGHFITTPKGKKMIAHLPEEVLKYPICNFCQTIDNPTLIKHCSLIVCKRCYERVGYCTICNTKLDLPWMKNLAGAVNGVPAKQPEPAIARTSCFDDDFGSDNEEYYFSD